MGGAADLPQRSSSPLKRRASDLDGEHEHKAEVTLSEKEDVDMVTVPHSDEQENTDVPLSPNRIKRAQSIEMFKDVQNEEPSDATSLTQETAAVNLRTGVLIMNTNVYVHS